MSARLTRPVNPRADALFEASVDDVTIRRSRMFAWLMAAQWAAGLLVALTLSPAAWQGRVQPTHAHLTTALFMGGLLSLPGIALAVMRPGWVVTRHVLAAAQMGWSALLIHLTGGRIETHFHILGSLAFLASYRDWKVLVTATAVAIGDHLTRGLVWPESVFGVADPEWWRLLEHAWWLLFEDVVLFVLIRDGLREMRAMAESRAGLEEARATVEARVAERTAELAASREELESILEATGTLPWRWDLARQAFIEVGDHADRLLGLPAAEWLRPDFLGQRLHPDDANAVREAWAHGAAAEAPTGVEFRARHHEGHWVWLRASVAPRTAHEPTLKGLLRDVTEHRQVLEELGDAQKLESVGRLASGIAHEINTPIQFVSDSIHFVSEAFSDLLPLIAAQQALHEAALEGAPTRELADEVTQAEQTADLDYLVENVPAALERSVEGLERVATLVRSMKDFAHPDGKEKAPADLVRGLESTLIIARNEFKYVADVQTDFQSVPPVTCHISELNQVFLNLIVNAAHAIGEKVKGTETRGQIRVGARALDGQVEVAISDTGGGIPDEIRQKVFEPFFTTKEVGRGTGQGLAIARSVVVDKHQGTLSFESTVGVGTTFFVRLPCPAATAARSEAA